MLVAAGYSHAFCTPHIWPNLPQNIPEVIEQRTKEVQRQYDEAGVDLNLLPGGELNLRPETVSWSREQVPTYAMKGKYCIFDLWADKLPPFFWPAVEHLQSLQLKLIIAHPERLRAVQEDVSLADEFLARGLILQGNLQCFSDAIGTSTRRTVEKLLVERKYFLLGTDTHRADTLPMRLNGLPRAIELAGQEYVDQLTISNPQVLI